MPPKAARYCALPVLAALWSAASLHGAQAQDLLDATDPHQIVEIARGFGSARLERDGQGDPMITGRINGIAYLINFYHCKNGAECESIQLRAHWTAEPGLDQSAALASWNRTKLYGRAFLDSDNDPTLDFVVNLLGGVSLRNLDDTFNLWASLIGEFETYLAEGGDLSDSPLPQRGITADEI